MSPVVKFHIIAVWCIFTAFIIFIIRTKHIFYYSHKLSTENHKSRNSHNRVQLKTNFKYVLIWRNSWNLEEGNREFSKRNCSNINCYMTANRHFFEDITKFPVIIFLHPFMTSNDLPKSRSQYQKYIFSSTESSGYYPVCDEIFNDFFNWTWTYKLNSDELFKYISIRNKEGDMIGPKPTMYWKKVEEMEPINEDLKKKLRRKKYAAAWFVSNCETPGDRYTIAEQLMVKLEQYGHTIHIYGACGTRSCPKSKMTHCLESLENDYYFYLAFENSLSEDYVTEKLLYALQHYTVPVVFGGANYSRFMPKGIYLDATLLTVSRLAKEMVELINNKEKYYNYFKWHNYYTYTHGHDTPELDSYCRLCSMISDEKRFETTSVYNNFIDWWSDHNACFYNS